MYEMKLKPNANIKYYSALHNISKTQFDEFKKEGIDALYDGHELNLLNPNAVESWKKIDTWREVPSLYRLKRTKREGVVTFDNDQKMQDFLKDYREFKLSDKTIYVPTDNTKEEAYELGSGVRKWDNGLVPPK